MMIGVTFLLHLTHICIVTMANVMVRIAFKLLLVGACLAFCLGENLSTGVDVDSYVEKMIHSNDVMVFAKSYCPYCRHTRQLLQVRLPLRGWDGFGSC